MVYGSRALLLDFPYHQRISDVLLFGTFDGTSHLLLDQIQRWLKQLVQVAYNTVGCRQASRHSSLQQMRLAYQAHPQAIATSARQADSLLVPGPLQTIDELSVHAQWLSLHPMQQIVTALLALVRHCQTTGDWERDQGLRFELAKQLAWLETLIALVEVADPGVRLALGIERPVAGGAVSQAQLAFCFGWFGGKVCAELRRLKYAVGGASVIVGLGEAEASFGAFFDNT